MREEKISSERREETQEQKGEKIEEICGEKR